MFSAPRARMSTPERGALISRTSRLVLPSVSGSPSSSTVSKPAPGARRCSQARMARPGFWRWFRQSLYTYVWRIHPMYPYNDQPTQPYQLVEPEPRRGGRPLALIAVLLLAILGGAAAGGIVA